MKYFNYFEFDSPDIQGSGQLMSKELLEILDEVREDYGKPIVITSGYRTEAHNVEADGKKNSSHLKGLAVDVACTESRDRFELVRLFLEYGITRIGIADTFIHIDIDDEDKSPNVIWTY
jgi:uncharacterized protein YcbK (DUF882 family)